MNFPLPQTGYIVYVFNIQQTVLNLSESVQNYKTHITVSQIT